MAVKVVEKLAHIIAHLICITTMLTSTNIQQFTPTNNIFTPPFPRPTACVWRFYGVYVRVLRIRPDIKHPMC